MTDGIHFGKLTDEQLIRELTASCGRERREVVRVLRMLAEVDRRKLYAERGFSSLFQFCVRELSMSEDEAGRRMTVARATRRFPLILAMMERGELHLTGASKLVPWLTAENHRALLEAAKHKTTRQIEEQIAAALPKPDVSASIRRLNPRENVELPLLASMPMTPAAPPVCAPAAPVSATSSSIPPASPAAPVLAPAAPACATSPSIPPAPAVRNEKRRDKVQPLAPERYAIRFTASGRCRELLERAQALMSHRSPNADIGEVMEEALAVLVEQLERKKFKTTANPRPSREKATSSKEKATSSEEKATPSKNKRYIPAEVRRAVYERDEGRCTYVGPTGHRCGERRFLELDHITPVALGGESTVDQLRLRCRAHNDLWARQVFGDRHMTLVAQGFRPVPHTQPKRSSQPELPLPG